MDGLKLSFESVMVVVESKLWALEYLSVAGLVRAVLWRRGLVWNEYVLR